MENKNMLEKTLDIAGSMTKIAANMTEPKKEPKPEVIRERSDDSNRANQNVVVSLESGKKKEPKPVEKHIHTFPENRPLTTEECSLDLKKAQMEHEYNMAAQEHIIRMDNLAWQHKLEQEKKNERKGKIRRVIGGILVALGVGTVGYTIYTDYRDQKNNPVAPVNPVPSPEPVKTEGTVE